MPRFVSSFSVETKGGIQEAETENLQCFYIFRFLSVKRSEMESSAEMGPLKIDFNTF